MRMKFFVFTTLASIIVSASAQASRGKMETPAERRKLEEMQRANQGLAANIRLMEVAHAVGVPAKDFVAFFKREMGNAQADMKAWNELLSIQSSETLRPYFELRNNENLRDSIAIREADLLRIQKTWSKEAQRTLANVLKAAVENAKSGKYSDTQSAYEDAMRAYRF